MRTLVLVLMIALLPLRGWVGEAMAGHMAAHQLSAIKSVAASPDGTGAAADFSSQAAMQAMPDCHERPAAAEPVAADVCASCSHCQVCAAVAFEPGTALLAGLAAAPARPATAAERFASAPRAAAIKPPIS